MASAVRGFEWSILHKNLLMRLKPYLLWRPFFYCIEFQHSWANLSFICAVRLLFLCMYCSLPLLQWLSEISQCFISTTYRKSWKLNNWTNAENFLSLMLFGLGQNGYYAITIVFFFFFFLLLPEGLSYNVSVGFGSMFYLKYLCLWLISTVH